MTIRQCQTHIETYLYHGIVVRGKGMGIEKGTGKEIGGRRYVNSTMNVRSLEAGQDNK